MNESESPCHHAVLVVDDNPVNVELLQDLLEDHGFRRVAGLCDPREVLGYCQASPPDLVLLDIRMPHLDGYGVLGQLQEAFGDEGPAVIVLTAQVDDATRDRALSLGVRDFITKPFDQREVLQRIRNALRVESRYRQRRSQASHLERLVAERTRELERLSVTDPVTQLLNRRGLADLLQRWQQGGREVGVLFVALDDIHDIMRLQGHRVSDAFLHGVARRLGEVLPGPATLGIWGSHELLAVVPDAELGGMEVLAHRFLAVLTTPVPHDSLTLHTAARIGIASGKGLDAARLVHMAALALPFGQDAVGRYSRAHEQAEQRRLSLRQRLRGACDRGETDLHFQPKVDLASGRLVGAEALVRWASPVHGDVSPGEFIPLAEASGDIVAIGAWVLETGLARLADWRRRGQVEDDFCLALNVAPQQLCEPDFARQVLARLEVHDLAPRSLEVEVTETGLMADPEGALGQLERLAAAGVGIAIDDFGTGHSSLAYLKRLPVTTLKVDRSFLSGMVERERDRRLVESIVAMAHGLGCRVVAEGIESLHQADLLTRLGCELGQGYWYARPMAEDDFLAWAQARPLSVLPAG